MSGYVATDAVAYERMMGRWSRMLADALLDAVPLPRGAAVLDAGCGTGALAEALAARDPTARITGVDLSEIYLAAARARVPGGTFRTGDLTRLPDADGSHDAALCMLVMQFVPDRAATAAELLRVTRPGGTVAAAMWDFVGGFTFVRAVADSIAATEPDGEAFRARFFGDSMGSPGRLAGLLEGAGALGVAERDICIRQHFADFTDLWEPWLSGQGVAGAYVAGLDPQRRARVEALARRAYLAGAPDGPRSFVAVARLATGIR